MKKILFSALLLAGFSATAQVKVGSNPTTLATDANFQVEATNGTQFFINKPNGNVGIGTTTPKAVLDVLANNDDTTVFPSMVVRSTSDNLRLLLTDRAGNDDIHNLLGQGAAYGLAMESNLRSTGGSSYISAHTKETGSVSDSYFAIRGGHGAAEHGHSRYLMAMNTATGEASINGLLPPEIPTGASLTIGRANGISPGTLLLNPQNTTNEGGQIILAKDLTNGTVAWGIDQFGGDGTATNKPRFRILTTVEHLSLLENGNLGLGIGNPRTKLDISGNLKIVANGFISSNLFYDSGWKYNSNGAGGFIKFPQPSEGGGINFNIAPENTSGNDAPATISNAMTIAINGNVGIGTSNPSVKLEVIGSLTAGKGGRLLLDQANTTNQGGQLIFNKDATYGTVAWGIDQFGGDGTATSLPRLRIYRSNIETLNILENGNVGIGSNIMPTEKLQVSGSVKSDSTILSTTTATVGGACTKEGEIKYNGTQFVGCANVSGTTKWVQLN